MTSTEQRITPGQPSDPTLFAPLTTDENKILSAHLRSGWYKQSAVYPVLSGPWQETAAILDDLGEAWDAAFEAEHPASRDTELAEPEAGA